MKRVQMRTVKGTTVKSEEITLEQYVTHTVGMMNALRMTNRTTVLYPSLRESLECLAQSSRENAVVMTAWVEGWCDLHFWIEG